MFLKIINSYGSYSSPIPESSSSLSPILYFASFIRFLYFPQEFEKSLESPLLLVLLIMKIKFLVIDVCFLVSDDIQ